MANLEISVQDIEQLLDKFSATNLTSMSLTDGSFELKLKREQERVVFAANEVTAQPSSAAVTASSHYAEVETNESLAKGQVLKAPIVGTFYRSPAPDKDPFVEVGRTVNKGDVLYIIESMKLMNEVTSDCNGMIAEIMVEDGQGVEFGEPIMRIE